MTSSLTNADVLVGATATLIASIVAASVSWWLHRISIEKSELQRLNDQLLQINAIGMEYPYLEDSKFIKRWAKSRESSKEKFIRYDLYCCIVFNFLESVSRFYRYDIAKIVNFVDIKEMLEAHREWWKSPPGNADANQIGYSKEFRRMLKQMQIAKK